MRRNLAALIPALILLELLISNSANAELFTQVEIFEIDRYTKSALAGDNVTFNWTLRSRDAECYTAYINLTAGLPPGWNANVTPPSIVLRQMQPRTVTVTVPVPKGTRETCANISVEFTILQNNSVMLKTTKNVLIIISLQEVPKVKRVVLGLFENPLPPPLDNEWGEFIMEVLVWLGISALVVVVLDPVVKRLTRKTKTKVDDIVLGIIRLPLLILLFFYGFTESLFVLDKHIPAIVLDYVKRGYQIAFVLILIYVAYRLFKDIFIYYCKQIAKKTATKIDDIVIPIIEKVVVFIIGLAAVGYVLGYLGFDITMLVAGGVVVSMVIAFAAQETLSNFFSGIFLLTDRPFAEGDTVILSDNDWYEVRKIGLRTTRLFRFKDASMVSIPNNKLANEKVANFTGVEDKGRVMKTFGVAYGSDPEKVKTIIRDVINGCEYIIKDNPNLTPIVRFDEMADSSLNFFVLVWITDRKYRFDVIDYLNTNIYKRFNEAGIEIPFPQRTVHLRYEQPPPPSLILPQPGESKVSREPPPAQKQETGADEGGDDGGEAGTI